MATFKHPNTPPQNALNKSVKLSTINLDTGAYFSEPYTITGPSGSFNLPLNSTSNGSTKIMIPLTTNTAPGSYYLKLHMPDNTSNTDMMYVTFAVRAPQMMDGYYDYVSGIPTAYRTALRTWILDGSSSIPFAPTPRHRVLSFTVYGTDTNQPAQAIPFKIDFSGLFGTQQQTGGATSLPPERTAI